MIRDTIDRLLLYITIDSNAAIVIADSIYDTVHIVGITAITCNINIDQ